MKRIPLSFFIIIIIIASSCGGSKKIMKNSVPEPEMKVETIVIPEPVVVAKPPPPEPIKEIVERLIPAEEAPARPDSYFIIIGSFRVYDNAINYQEQIKKDGFSSVLLKNEAGLYRVSVTGTNEISEARTEIRRIRSIFSKYRDVWLLIQEK